MAAAALRVAPAPGAQQRFLIFVCQDKHIHFPARICISSLHLLLLSLFWEAWPLAAVHASASGMMPRCARPSC